jgi:hypothetical protein
MKNYLYILTAILIFAFSETISFAETKKDCSQYSTKTLAGLADYMRCKKGLDPDKKNFFKKLEYKSLKNKNFEENENKPAKACHEYTTKTVVGLAGKLRCKLKNDD